MELKVCKRCGGKIQFHDERNVYICLYCKTEFKPSSDSAAEAVTTEDIVHSTESSAIPDDTEKRAAAKSGLILVAIGLVAIGLIIFWVLRSNSSSGVNFTDARTRLTHHNLTFDVPTTATIRRSDAGNLITYFDHYRGEIYVIAFSPVQKRDDEMQLEDFKNNWFLENRLVSPEGTSETMMINDSTAIIQEAISNAGWHHTVAFVYANEEVYVFQYHSMGDRHFSTYRPYFIEILKSISWMIVDSGADVDVPPTPEGGSGTGSSVDFSGEWVLFPHRNLILEIPETIVPRPIGDANQHVGLPFDAEENAWVAAFNPAQNRTAAELVEFKDNWFVNHGTLMPVALAEMITVNGQTAFLQEARSDTGGQSTLAFVYANGEIYVFQYHAGDRFFDAYRPYFIEMLARISW